MLFGFGVVFIATAVIYFSDVSWCGSPDLVTYWGQNKAYASLDTVEQNLATLCKPGSPYSTIVVGYVSRFSDVRNADGLPGMGFSVHCGRSQDPAHVSFLYCPKIGRDIRYCQKQGKKILIGIGGPGTPARFETNQKAENFAKLIWNLFLGGDDLPDLRPFGGVSLDGINLFMPTHTPAHSNVFVRTLDKLRKSDASQAYEITITTTCKHPDPYFGPGGHKLLDDSVSLVDAIYVRYTEGTCCMRGTDTFRASLKFWQDFVVRARHPVLYLGVPAALPAARTPRCYRTPRELMPVFDALESNAYFRGFAVIDNSFDLQDPNEGYLFSKPLLELTKMLNPDVVQAPGDRLDDPNKLPLNNPRPDGEDIVEAQGIGMPTTTAKPTAPIRLPPRPTPADLSETDDDDDEEEVDFYPSPTLLPTTQPSTPPLPVLKTTRPPLPHQEFLPLAQKPPRPARPAANPVPGIVNETANDHRLADNPINDTVTDSTYVYESRKPVAAAPLTPAEIVEAGSRPSNIGVDPTPLRENPSILGTGVTGAPSLLTDQEKDDERLVDKNVSVFDESQLAQVTAERPTRAPGTQNDVNQGYPLNTPDFDASQENMPPVDQNSRCPDTRQPDCATYPDPHRFRWNERVHRRHHRRHHHPKHHQHHSVKLRIKDLLAANLMRDIYSTDTPTKSEVKKAVSVIRELTKSLRKVDNLISEHKQIKMQNKKKFKGTNKRTQSNSKRYEIPQGERQVDIIYDSKPQKDSRIPGEFVKTPKMDILIDIPDKKQRISTDSLGVKIKTECAFDECDQKIFPSIDDSSENGNVRSTVNSALTPDIDSTIEISKDNAGISEESSRNKEEDFIDEIKEIASQQPQSDISPEQEAYIESLLNKYANENVDGKDANLMDVVFFSGKTDGNRPAGRKITKIFDNVDNAATTGENRQMEFRIPEITNPNGGPGGPPDTLLGQIEENKKYLKKLQDDFQKQVDAYNKEILKEQPARPEKVDTNKTFPYKVPSNELDKLTSDNTKIFILKSPSSGSDKLEEKPLSIDNKLNRFAMRNPSASTSSNKLEEKPSSLDIHNNFEKDSRERRRRNLAANVDVKGNMDHLKKLMSDMQRNIENANAAMQEKQKQDNDSQQQEEEEEDEEDGDK